MIEINNFVGIDLGTTNTVVSYINEFNEVKVLELNKSSVTPSVLFFDEKKVLIGKKALSKMNLFPECGIKVWKRKIGTSHSFYVKEFSKMEKELNKYLVVDTNIFINNLDFEKKVFNDEKIVLPFTVRDEINYRKKQPETNIQADNASEVISYLFKEKFLEFREYKEKFVPKGAFISNNDSNDNKVLAVAKELDSEGKEVLLLTNDRGLREKASSCGVKTVSYEEFVCERKDIERTKTKRIGAEQATAIFLTELKKQIDKAMKNDIKKAVIAYPAVFRSLQIESIKRAAIKAGFEEVKLIKEPVAAALVYGIESTKDENIAVYDFGGGTFDFSVIKCEKNTSIEVLITDGDENLGGEDISKKLAEFIRLEAKDFIDEKYEGKFNVDEILLDEKNKEFNENLIDDIADNVKKMISISKSESVELENYWVTNEIKDNITLEITIEDFIDEAVFDVVKSSEKVMNRAFKQAKMKVEEIDKIILCGGTAMIPEIQDEVRGFLAGEILKTKDMSTLVSNGAAIQGSRLFKENKNVKDTTIIEKYVTKDFINFSIGMKLDGNIFSSMIEYKTKLPCEKTKTYMLANDNQDVATFNLFCKKKDSEGVYVTDEGIEELGKVSINGLSKFNREDIDLEVTIRVNNDSTLNLKAVVKDRVGRIVEDKKIELEINF